MHQQTLSAEEVKKRSLVLLKHHITTLYLATFDLNGYPDVRPLELCLHHELDTLWFGSAISTKKCRQLEANPKCTLYGNVAATAEELRLSGEITLLADMDSRRLIWGDAFLSYFPDGIESPEFVVLKFTTQQGNYSTYNKAGYFYGGFIL